MEAAEVSGRVAAIIRAADTLEADIAVPPGLACARCRDGRGCGAGLLGSSTGDRVIRVRVPAGMQLAAGDPVTLHMHGPALLAAAGIAYGLPLAGLLLGALLGHLFIAGELAASLTALAGLIVGAWFARRRAARFCWQHGAAGLLRLEAGPG